MFLCTHPRESIKETYIKGKNKLLNNAIRQTKSLITNKKYIINNIFLNTVVVVVCEHGESPAFKKRENWR